MSEHSTVVNTDQSQVKSKLRVRDHGEVFTAEREVNAMLDLVKDETERIESRFLEPACGDGNFLIEILRRKLEVVFQNYKKNQFEYERYAIIAISCLYGVDILQDNVESCKIRLLDCFENKYTSLYTKNCNPQVVEIAKFILTKNILCGDALTLKKDDGTPIVFAEWTPINGTLIKRKDYTLANLLVAEDVNNLPLFSDTDEPVYLPTPVKEFKPKHFMRLDEDE